LRYLTNELRKAFGLKGVPVRFVLRGSKNPYAKD
jgi:GTP-binding protein